MRRRREGLRRETDDLWKLWVWDFAKRLRVQPGETVQGQVFGPVGGIEVTVEAHTRVATVVCRYQVLVRGRFVPEESGFWLSSTEPTYGGLRWWFTCPRKGCRCGVLYFDPLAEAWNRWGCRRCLGLVYPSSRETPRQRRARRERRTPVWLG